MTTEVSPRSAATEAMQRALIHCDDTPIVFDYVHASGPDGINFDVWYCNTHLPKLIKEHSIQRLRRYTVPSRSSLLAVGELDVQKRLAQQSSSSDSLSQAVASHEQFIGEPLGTLRHRDASESVVDSAVVYPALLRVPDERMQEVGRWYEQEHLPMLFACPQWVMTRRFRITAPIGIDFTHVALHYLLDLRALQSPQREAARDTPWRDKLKAEGWFAPEYRVCYRAHDF